MTREFTAVYRNVPEGYIGYVEEVPGTNTQGATLEEVRENLKEAVALVIEASRALAREQVDDDELIRKSISVPSWNGETSSSTSRAAAAPCSGRGLATRSS